MDAVRARIGKVLGRLGLPIKRRGEEKAQLVTVPQMVSERVPGVGQAQLKSTQVPPTLLYLLNVGGGRRGS
jgi:hypothetical protein